MIGLLVLAACDDNENSTSASDNGTGENGDGKVEDVIITIGNLTDQTGVAADAIQYVEMALDDLAGYYNDNNLIPGVKFKVVDYDEQWDTARDIPGYQKLKKDGADFIWTPVAQSLPVLKPHLDRDKFPLFAATANMDQSDLNGGYVFSLGITPKYEAYTLLEWIAENDEDFPSDRPARVGGAAWNDGYNNVLIPAAKEYVDGHDNYEWDKTLLTDFSFNWTTQAEELKDCDYVFVPTPPNIFMRDFRKAGGTAKFLGTDPPAAFLSLIGEAGLWEEADGTLFLRSSRWYNETGEFIDITNQLLSENHSPKEIEEIRSQGCGYIAVKNTYLMLDIVRKAVEAVGAENFDSQALYDAATSWTYEYEGISDFNSFDENKRIAQNYYAVYELDAAEEDIFRVHKDWLPQVTSPEQ